MEKFVEKFNVFDLFTTLIPGIIIMSLFGISLSFQWYEKWETYGNEKYVIFFVFSYFCGVLFQEIGDFMDKIFMCKILYGGEPRKIFLLNEYKERIFHDELSYENMLEIKEYIDEYVSPKIKKEMDDESYNALVFSYCLNICELNGMSAKIDRMIAISELSRALFWGCIATIVLNLWLLYGGSCNAMFLKYEIIGLCIAALIFMRRKVRFERYRVKMLFRTFLIYQKSKSI